MMCSRLSAPTRPRRGLSPMRPGRALTGIACLVTASALGLTPGCFRAGEDRALSDLDIGRAELSGVAAIEVEDGLAHVRDMTPPSATTPGRVLLRGAAPSFSFTLTSDTASDWEITADNIMPDALMSVLDGDAGSPSDITDDDIAVIDGPRPTVRVFRFTAPAGVPIELRVAPPDAEADGDPDGSDEPWRFAVMGDVQSAMPEVHEVFERINLDPTIRFVVSTGDITESAGIGEYSLWEQQLSRLDVPYFSTIGNHELMGPHQRWSERFGRFNVHFRFRGAAFSLVDSGDASVDPLVFDWLDEWLQAARDDVHFFFTHFPPIDPVGTRGGSFRSATEAHKLVAALAVGRVDVTFYGHIHSYYAYANAGIPAYISGGGGAIPERWDGIGRHFLTVDVVGQRVENVAVVRVD